jgi:hypothetical protein
MSGYFDQNATGYREAEFKLNNTTKIGAIANYYAGGSPNYPYITMSCTVYLAVADYVEVFVKQTSGGSLGFFASTPDYFTATYLGA